MRICGRSHVCVDAQSAVNIGRPRIYMDGQRRQSLGRPIMWPTSRILDVHYVMAGVPHNLHWPPTKLFWRPRNVMDAQQMLSWMPTKICGRPRELVDIHAKSWAPISRNMDGHHALMDTHDTYCGHPAHYRGRSCYADGVPRLFLGAHEKNVDFHAFRWTAATFLWTFTKLVWLATENMWSLTHLAGSPRKAMDAHLTIVDAHHSVMGDHAALWWRIGVCGRVWMRVYTQA